MVQSLTSDGIEVCFVIFRYCLALLMVRLSSWTAMGECWPMCSFMNQMASSACLGTTPASWWRTAVRATQILTTIPHHRVGSLHVLLFQLCWHSQTPGSSHVVLKQQDSCGFKQVGDKRWCIALEVESGVEQNYCYKGVRPALPACHAVRHSSPMLLCLHLHSEVTAQN